jgi:glucose/arabinose dehydrogenase
VWSSGASTIALSGIDFLKGSAWGTWSGRIVGAVLKNHELRMFTLDPTGTQVTGTTKLYDDGSTRLRVPVLGPDGALYVATDTPAPGGQIWRITKA